MAESPAQRRRRKAVNIKRQAQQQEGDVWEMVFTTTEELCPGITKTTIPGKEPIYHIDTLKYERVYITNVLFYAAIGIFRFLKAELEQGLAEVALTLDDEGIEECKYQTVKFVENDMYNPNGNVEEQEVVRFRASLLEKLDRGSLWGLLQWI